jgi:hypothetical protein
LAAAGELQAEPAAKRAKPAPAIPDASNHGLHIGAKEQKYANLSCSYVHKQSCVC